MNICFLFLLTWLAAVQQNNDALRLARAQHCQQHSQIGCQQASAIVCSNLPEHNAKIVQHIYMQWLAAGEFTPAQLQSLQEIAEQCYLEGGAAVYRARALRSLVELANYDDDCANTATQRRGAVDGNTAIDRGELRVLPNPANDKIHVTTPQEVGDMRITLYNALGQEVYAANAPYSDVHTIDVQHLPAGIYTCRVQSGAQTWSSQFIISQ